MKSLSIHFTYLLFLFCHHILISSCHRSNDTHTHLVMTVTQIVCHPFSFHHAIVIHTLIMQTKLSYFWYLCLFAKRLAFYKHIQSGGYESHVSTTLLIPHQSLSSITHHIFNERTNKRSSEQTKERPRMDRTLAINITHLTSVWVDTCLTLVLSLSLNPSLEVSVASSPVVLWASA